MELIDYIIAVTFLSVGFIQGISGFGGGLIAVPVLATMLPMTLVAPLISLQGIFLTGSLAWRLRQYIQIKRFLPMIIAGCLTTPLGVMLLLNVDVNLLKASVGALVTLSAIALLFNIKLNIAERKTTYATTGMLSGTLNGLCAISGPPVVLLLANQGVAKNIFRANVCLFFTTIAAVNVASFASQSLFSVELVQAAVIAIPATLTGSGLGNKVAARIAEKPFSKLVMTIILLSGINLLFLGFQGIS